MKNLKLTWETKQSELSGGHWTKNERNFTNLRTAMVEKQLLECQTKSVRNINLF